MTAYVLSLTPTVNHTSDSHDLARASETAWHGMLALHRKWTNCDGTVCRQGRHVGEVAHSAETTL